MNKNKVENTLKTFLLLRFIMEIAVEEIIYNRDPPAELTPDLLSLLRGFRMFSLEFKYVANFAKLCS